MSKIVLLQKGEEGRNSQKWVVVNGDKFSMVRNSQILAGGKKFSKIDPLQAYQQMILEPDHRKHTTINTHLGLF